MIGKSKYHKRKNDIYISGRTIDDKLVLSNIFIQTEFRGIPLEFLISELDNENMVINWVDFYEDSMKALWNPLTTIKKIKIALDDVKGKQYSEAIINRLKYYIASKHKEI